MVIARDGTLYFADQANNRIRAIAPDGTISTVAGNGRGGWVGTGTAARSASILSPSAVAIGPYGRLYIADSGWNEVLRLERNGTVTEIAGNQRYGGVYGIGHPAVHASPDGPSGLAFDRAGNLYLAGFDTKTLLMITSREIMTRPSGLAGFYPRGDGALVAVPNGSVYAANDLSIVRLSPHGMATIYNFIGKRFDGIRAFLPQGIAVAPNGDIYADTALGNGFANATALIVVRPGERPRVLWKG
jgi:streptogramin lyase